MKAARITTGISNRRGLTLIELLIAMVVLLVGIYTVAAGFPKLLEAIRGEGTRTSLARLAEQALTDLTGDSWGVPDAITGGGSIHPDSFREDMTDLSDDLANAQESLIDVIGEPFRVPAAYVAPGGTYVAGTSAQYVLRQGPAQWSSGDGADTTGYPYVYLLVPLTEQRDDPRLASSGGLAANSFYVDLQAGNLIVPASVTTADGHITRSWTVDEVVADYAWAESTTAMAPYPLPVLHYVQGETVGNISGSGPLTAKVRAAHLPAGTFGQLVAGQTRAWAKVYFVRESFGVAYPSGPRRYVLENNYGATLRFHPQDTGLTLRVDYRLRTDAAGRRVLLMREDHTVQGQADRTDGAGNKYMDVRLAVGNLEEEPIFDADLLGNPLTTPVHVLAVDLTTGATHYDGEILQLENENLEPPLNDGYSKGLVTLPIETGGVSASYIGHKMRFYYQSLDRHNIQIQKAPRHYVDWKTASAYQAAYLTHLGAGAGAAEAASLAEVDYRTYELSHAAPPYDANRRLGVIQFGQYVDEDEDPGTEPTWAFADSSAGMTVSVNYSYWVSASEQRQVWGELHTVSPGGSRIVLNHATVVDRPITIFAINGVSARARAWWLSERGKQKKLDIETCYLPLTPGLLPRVW